MDSTVSETQQLRRKDRAPASQGGRLGEPRAYVRRDCVVFRKTKDEFGGLSNMAPGFPLLVSGVAIRTSEALYQACRYPHMPDVQRLIVNETSPMTLKMRTRHYRPQSRPDWDDVRHKIMRWCLRVKLAENWDAFGALLLATGERDIVEDSAKDSYWGAIDNGEGLLRGQNVLGRLLMELRSRLRQERDALMYVPALPLKDFLLLGQEIDDVGLQEGGLREVRDDPFLLAYQARKG
ncbi:NADAR family protein [Burkholderia gladioli]|uniref:NADAR family protein n=1 Tax=Burkholderia gladioli TaxID=28095 RepID=UPI00265AE4EF|nr:NADAR family protein [Burkholderia gladioli]